MDRTSPSALMRHDHRLLRQVRNGQVNALGGLYDRHGQHCVRRALKIHGDQTSAEDAVLAAFMQLWRDPPGNDGSILSWLSARTAQST